MCSSQFHHAIECDSTSWSHSTDTGLRPGWRLSAGTLSGLLEAGWNPHQPPAPPIHLHNGMDQQVLLKMRTLAIIALALILFLPAGHPFLHAGRFPCRTTVQRGVAHPRAPASHHGIWRVAKEGSDRGKAHSKSQHRRETVPLYWGCAGRAGNAAGVLRAEILTPDLKCLLAQTALCWPRGNAGYKWSPHQSTTPTRKLYDVAPQKAGYKSIGLPENCSSWDDSMPASGGWSRINCGG